jgi:hypothetical protein
MCVVGRIGLVLRYVRYEFFTVSFDSKGEGVVPDPDIIA